MPDAEKCVGFDAVSSTEARVLILGSLPGAESLKKQEYYAKKANSFWRIMAVLLGTRPDLSYPERLCALKENKIALWDVCAAAERVGSLDANIKATSIVPNDFAAFLKAHKQIQLICFNGQPAERLFCRKVLAVQDFDFEDIRRVVLPSTSPAHAKMRFEEKLAKWRKALISD